MKRIVRRPTGGTYRFTSGGVSSEPLPHDATQEERDRAVTAILRPAMEALTEEFKRRMAELSGEPLTGEELSMLGIVDPDDWGPDGEPKEPEELRGIRFRLAYPEGPSAIKRKPVQEAKPHG